MLVRKANEQFFEDADLDGVEFNRLYADEQEEGGGATIVRMKAGVEYPRHAHPGNEQAMVLTGRVLIDGHDLGPGDYWYTAPGEVHSAVATEDLTFFVVTEQAIRILDES